jgi:hypothetical protein
MLIMPLLSQMLFTVIITYLSPTIPVYKGYRFPPPSPPAVWFHPVFMHRWNVGLYPKITRYKKQLWFQDAPTSARNDLPPMQTQPTADSAVLLVSNPFSAVPHVCSIQGPRSAVDNSRMLALLYLLSTPKHDSVYNFGTDTERICIDTGTSACISTHRDNFVTFSPINNLKVNGIGSGLPVEGSGLLKWPIQDDNNNEVDLYVKDALYVPKALMGLLYPQQIAQQTGKSSDGFHAFGDRGILTFDGYQRTVQYDPRSRLPLSNTVDNIQCYLTSSQDAALPSTENLSRAQKSLLRWHTRLSHMSFQKLQDLARQGRLPKSILGCSPPLCCSCLFGKAHRRPTPSTDAHNIDSGDLTPDDRVSVDQIESSTPGYVDTFRGKPTKAKYTTASLYVDHASRYTFVKCHFTTNGTEAVEGKRLFEQLAHSHGISVKAYRADNGIMACQEYVQYAAIHQQTITYCGINQHEQNGIAERAIRTLCDRARTMLLHAMEKSPDAITLDLWPFALRVAADIHNATPGPSGLSPEEIFSQQKSRPDRLLDFHTFGCPVFVLHPSSQEGKKIPKWQPRARQAVYLGHSPRHAQTVPIVLNLNTGMCSPQYHVVFDDYFTTTNSRATNTLPSEWDTLFTHNRVNVLAEETPDSIQHLQLAPEWGDQEIAAEQDHNQSLLPMDSMNSTRTTPQPISAEHSDPIPPQTGQRTPSEGDAPVQHNPTAQTPTPEGDQAERAPSSE